MINGYQTSSSRRDSAAGTRTYPARARCPALPATARSTLSAAEYSGTRTRSCSSAAPTIHSATPSQSPAKSRSPA
ncbi:hypothetical protein C1N81_42865 [Streptomyces sp. SGAir0957]